MLQALDLYILLFLFTCSHFEVASIGLVYYDAYIHFVYTLRLQALDLSCIYVVIVSLFPLLIETIFCWTID